MSNRILKNINRSLVYGVFTLLSALCISAVAAYYSIVGLMALFSGAALSIGLMGGALEAGKLVTASWLYNNWKKAPILLKSYLTGAVVVLMLITSMGIFGFLSKAHLAQVNPIGNVQAQVENIDFEIAQQQKRIDRSNHILEQFDSALQEYIKRGYVTRALKQRDEQKEEIVSLQKEIKEASDQIDLLSTKKFNIQKELRGFEAEVGPVKYIAELIYGEEQAKALMDQMVRYVIIFLIFVFDPLAVLLVIAGNMSIKEALAEKQKSKEQQVQPSLSLPKEKKPVYETVRKDGYNPPPVLPRPLPNAPPPPPPPISKTIEEKEKPKKTTKTEPTTTLVTKTIPVEPLSEEAKSVEDMVDSVLTNASKNVSFNLSSSEPLKRALVKAIKSEISGK